MNDWKFWIVLAVLVLIIIRFLHKRLAQSNQKIEKPTKCDSDFYNLNNDYAYRNGVYRQVNIDFKPYIENLYRSIDEVYAKTKQYQGEINQAQYNSMVEILRSADAIERQIKEYWQSNRFKKDFMHYIGLHYASHLLAGTIKAEQQRIKQTFVACKNRQEQWSRKIEAAQRQQERIHGEQRRKMSTEIGEMCKIHKRISTLKGQIGAINTKYNNRVTQQNIETARRRDYIGTHFGERGERWRTRIMAKHR